MRVVPQKRIFGLHLSGVAEMGGGKWLLKQLTCHHTAVSQLDLKQVSSNDLVRAMLSIFNFLLYLKRLQDFAQDPQLK